MAETVVRFRGDAKDLNAKLAQVQRGLGGLQARSATANRALGSIQKSAGAVSSALRVAATAFAAFATTRAVGGILSATQSMEGFRTQLTTYLGSQERANAELGRLSKLARGLPQDVNQLTEAFVILNRSGISTTNENMTAFSKIAASNSKSIVQFAEAVADGMNGEFERFKEFGIKVSKESDGLVARLGSTQVATAKNSEELVNQLANLGKEGGKFANVTVGALTLSLSNFRGALFETSAAVGSGGFGAAVAELTDELTALISGSTDVVDGIGNKLTRAFLTAVAVGKFFIANIALIGKALLILMGIKIGLFFANMARAIILIALPALVMLGKGIRQAASALLFFVPGGPLVKGVIAGIGGLAAAWGLYKGATSEAAKETVDSFLDIDGILSGLGVQGLGELRKELSEVNAEAQRLSEESRKTTKAMTEEAAAVAAIKDEFDKKAQSIAQQNKDFDKYLAAKQEEYRITKLSAAEQEKEKELKAATSKLQRDLTSDEQKRLGTMVLENVELDKQLATQLALSTAIKEALAPSTDIEAVGAGASAVKKFNPAQTMKDDYETALRGLKLLRDGDRISEAEYLDTKLKMHRAYEDDLFDLQKSQAEARLRLNGVTNDEIINATMSQMEQVKMIQTGGVQGIQGVMGATANVFQSLGTMNRKAFETYKKLAIAQALMSTYQAAAMAIAFPPGPPLSFIYVAGAVAAGLAQVNAIRSQSFSGRQLGGPVMGGQGYLVGENGPELFTPNTTGSITRNGDLGGGGDVNVNFQIIANDTVGFDELLFNRRGLITQIVSDAMQERGQRSII